MKKSTVHQILLLAGAGVLALVVYDFIVQPVVTKAVAGALKQPQLR